MSAATRRCGLLAVTLLAALAFAAPQAGAAPSTRVIHGSTVVDLPTNWPFIVALVDDQSRFFCGGSLIAGYWVVTAAHCGTVDGIIFGRKQLSNTGTGERVPVVQQYVNPGWDPSTLTNDIQLLQLAHPPASAQTIAPASAIEDPAAGATADIAGWGVTVFGGSTPSDTLQEASLDVYSNASCATQWGTVSITILTSQICVAHWGADSSTDREACNGDSGGPLVYDAGGGPRLVGLTSFGRPGCDSYPFPNVYTRVSSFSGWIDGTVTRHASLAASKFDFGIAQAGGTAIFKQIDVVSSGSAAATVSNLSIAGLSSPAAGFSIVSDKCSGVALAPGLTCPIVVKFAPTDAGASSAVLKFDSEGGTSSASLTGFATSSIVPPKLGLSQTGHAKTLGGGKIKVTIKAYYIIPAGANFTTACVGNMAVTAKVPRVRKSVKRQGPAVWNQSRCVAKINVRMTRKALHKKVDFNVRFSGNSTISAAQRDFKLRIK